MSNELSFHDEQGTLWRHIKHTATSAALASWENLLEEDEDGVEAAEVLLLKPSIRLDQFALEVHDGAVPVDAMRRICDLSEKLIREE